MDCKDDTQHDEIIYRLLVSELERKIEHFDRDDWHPETFRNSCEPVSALGRYYTRSAIAISLGDFYKCLLVEFTVSHNDSARPKDYVCYYLSLVPEYLYGNRDFREDLVSVWRTDKDDKQKSRELERLHTRLGKAYEKEREIYEEEHLTDEEKLEKKKEAFFKTKKRRRDILCDIQQVLGER